MTLARVFWLGFALPLLPVIVAVGASNDPRGVAPWLGLVLALATVYYAAVAVALWRAAPNTGRPTWRRLGRACAVLTGFMVVAVAFQFLQR